MEGEGEGGGGMLDGRKRGMREGKRPGAKECCDEHFLV